MAKAKIPKSPDPQTQEGFDRRQFLSVVPVSLLGSSSPDASLGEFRRALYIKLGKFKSLENLGCVDRLVDAFLLGEEGGAA